MPTRDCEAGYGPVSLLMYNIRIIINGKNRVYILISE